MSDLPCIVDSVVHPALDDWTAFIKIRNVDGVAYDLTGWEFYVVISKSLEWLDEEAYVSAAFESTSPESGEVQLSIPAEQLRDPGLYFRGIKAKTDTGARVTLVTGTFELVAAGPKAL